MSDPDALTELGRLYVENARLRALVYGGPDGPGIAERLEAALLHVNAGGPRHLLAMAELVTILTALRPEVGDRLPTESTTARREEPTDG